LFDVRNRPVYAIGSVDRALLLATALQYEGCLGVSDAAERLGVSRSTAHRLLTTLVYRDFAVQGPDRRYRPGPVLRPAEASDVPVARLRQVCLPHLRMLTTHTKETSCAMVRVGVNVRFIATVECDQALRVGDRFGRVLPAHLVSGGRAMLASMEPTDVEELYRPLADEIDLPGLLRQLALVRREGFAINHEQTETGLTAVGVAVSSKRTGPAVAGISIAMPSVRFDRAQLPCWVALASRTAGAIRADL
jgi:IclR family acetate operon transcriptional repressor